MSSASIDIPVERIAEICRRYGVKELSVFGSAVRRELRADSDVDLLVDFEPEARIGLVKFANLNRELEEILGRRGDLVTKSGLKPRVRPEVLREARVVYSATLGRQMAAILAGDSPASSS